MAVNQKEIARLLGVTQATVSRALGDSPKVSAEVKGRVRELCQRVGYEPNYIGRSLSRRQTKTISVVLASDPDLLVTDVMSRWTAGLRYALHELRYRFRLDPVSSFSQVLGEGSADGFIVFSGTGELHPDVLVSLRSAARAIVLTDCPAADLRPGVVAIDGRVGMAEAVNHLVGLGHEKIAFVGLVNESGVCKERHRGYIEQLNELGFSSPSDFTVGIPGWPTEVDEVALHSAAIHRAIDGGATAIVCSSDIVAVGVAKLLKRRGLRVPDDVSVVGFDDTILARGFDPSLTTVRQDTATAAKLAAEMVVRAIEDGVMPAGVAIPASLVIRETTGPRGG